MRFRSQQPLRHPNCSKSIGLTQRGVSLSLSEITAGRVSLRLGCQKPAGLQREGHGHKPALRPGDCPFRETRTGSPLSRIRGQVARTARDASHPPKPCSLLGLVPLRVFWPLNVLHVACLQLSEEGEAVLGRGRWLARPPPPLRWTPWGPLTPLSRSMSRKWVARSSSGRRIWGGGVLVPESCLSASWGLGLTWPSVLQGTRYRESTRAFETHLILTETFQSPPGPWKEQSL